MALIKCMECGREVSSKAVTCPQCGNPIAGAEDVGATGVPLTTTQTTAKKFKALMLWATAACSFGVVLIVVLDPPGKMLGVLVFVGGLALYFVARMRAWWHHG